MDNIDIIFYILDIFKEEKNSNAIKKCMLINKLWYFIIIYNKNKYLKTIEMMSYLLENDSNYKNKIFDDTIKMISNLNFHKSLILSKDTKNSEKKEKNKIIKKIIKYVPNYKTNYLLISYNMLDKVYLSIIELIEKYVYIEECNKEYNNTNIDYLEKLIQSIFTELNIENIKKKDKKIDLSKTSKDINIKLKMARIFNQIIKLLTRIIIKSDKNISI